MTCCRAQPANVEGHGRPDRRGTLEAEQGVGDIEEVPDTQVLRPHPRLAIVQVDRHAALTLVFAAGLQRDRPEQALRVGIDPRVEVMNLGGEIREVELTSVQVKSNEPERRLVNLAVQADVGTLHEPHVGVEQQRLDAAVGIPAGSGSLHICDPGKALEIGDR